MKSYEISYSYNNGTTMTEKVSATSGIKALKKARAYAFLRDAMFQTGSTGTAVAYKLDEDSEVKHCDLEATLNCEYTCNGKWHARYFDF